MLNIVGGSLGGVQANNCGGIVPNGNCGGNPLWTPANGNWWTWGATGVPTTNCANSGSYDFAGGTTSSFTAVTVSRITVGTNAWNNCNCGSFNCYTNCNCNCACSTDSGGGGSCFPAGSKVTMADGSVKNIEDVQIGDVLRGARGEANLVLALDRPKLGRRKMAIINGHHQTTLSHPILNVENQWALIDRDEYFRDENGTRQEVIINERGDIDHWILPGIRKDEEDLIVLLRVGDQVHGIDGPQTIDTIEIISPPEDLQLYNFVMLGSHSYTVNGFGVSGFLNGIDFDFRTYQPRGEPYTVEDYRNGRTDGGRGGC